ncbi:peptide chain release factor N(5)-glutamine methyltransferase [Candidatus Saccharibacteria bacterium]|nr:peptide chain release factor N(5)-glutamine methyltransferase [Candidatus Saccharibacteria bacterium]
MIASEWLEQAKRQLLEAKIDTARLDSLVILEDITRKTRAWLLAHPEFELTQLQIRNLAKQIDRRAKHEPLAYIRGKTEFYGREFIVNKYTLVPRPETETILDLTNEIDLSVIQTVVDVGTGSGAVAIVAKLLFPKLEVIGIDIDKKCIQTAQQNAKLHNVSIDFRQGNLLDPVINDIPNDWLILANLPYVPDSHTINKAAMFEPKHAIFGETDGLDYYRKMFQQIQVMKKKPLYIFTESLPLQHNSLREIVINHNYKQVKEKDFIQEFMI